MRVSLAKMLLLFPYVGIWQLGYYEHLNEYLVVLAALFPLILLKKRDFRLDRTSLLSAFFGMFFIFLLIEPGIAYGKLEFSRIYGLVLLQTLGYSILLIISLLAMIHGIVLKGLWKRPFAGMAITAIIYIMTITPISLFFDLGNLVQLILFSQTFIVVLSFYLGFLYLKSNFNMLPGIIFLGSYTIFTSLGISVLVSNLFNLVWEVISLSIILFISDKIIREPASIKKIFRAKRVVRKKKSSIAILVTGLSVLLILLVALPMVTQESHYVIADPTDSMYPVIDPGSLLFISHISPGNVQVGAIIVFDAPWAAGTMYAHQVIGVNYSDGVEYFITKGVNNPAKDPLPVPASDLVGQVSFSVPYLGYILIYNQVTAAVILVLVGAFYAIDIKR
ncbi:MAG: signal peptidase I [Thermoplasmatales archaeon]